MMTDSLEKLKKEVADTPYLAHIGIELTEQKNGECTGRIKIEKLHTNLHGGVHGGCMFSLADTISCYAAMTQGTIVTTLNSSINYFHPVLNTEYLYCKSKIVKNGKTVCVVRAELYGDNGQIFADASFSCFVLGNR